MTTTINRPSNGTTSTITFDAPVGNDDFVFAVFDAANLGGNQLGGTELVQNIIAGVPNTVKATLDGYVANVSPSVISGSVSTSNDPGGQPVYTISGGIPAAFSLSLQDADGNSIIPPGTAPVVQVTSTNPDLLSVAPLAGNPNGYTVQKVSPYADWATGLGLRVQVSSGGGVQQLDYTFQLQAHPLLYATSGTGAAAKVTAFDEAGNIVALPGAFAGLNLPTAMAYDQDDDRLFVADAASQTIQTFGGDGSAVPGWLSPAVPGIVSLAFDSLTKTLVAATTSGSTPFLSFDTSGNAKPPLPFTGSGTPVALTYRRIDAPNYQWCGLGNGPTQCGLYYLVYQSGGQYFYAAYGDDGTRNGPLFQALNAPPPPQSLAFVPNGAISLSAYPNPDFAVTGTLNGSTIACVVSQLGTYPGNQFSPDSTSCLMSGLTSATSIAIDNHGLQQFTLNGNQQSNLEHMWIAGKPGGLVYASGATVNGSPQIDTSLSFPVPTGANTFSNVLLVY